jgi:hypothetical protein
MSGYRLRYKPNTPAGDKFPTIRYPMSHRPSLPTHAHAQTVLDAMPDPDRMEIVEENT